MLQINETYMNPVDKELIEEKFKNVYLSIEKNHNETTILLEKILEQTLKTNGRVTEIEDHYVVKEDFLKERKETHFFRTLTKYPKLTLFAVIGIASLISTAGAQLLIKFLG